MTILQCWAGENKFASSRTSDLHSLPSLFSAGIPVYLLVSISSSADPPLNLARRERCALEVTTFMYGSFNFLLPVFSF